MIDFRPLCPPADPDGRARSRPSSRLHVVDDDEEVRQLDLVEPQQLADRVAAEVHERQRLGEQRRRRPATSPISASAGADSHSSRCRSASRSTTSKPTLCRVPVVLPPGIAQADNELHSSPLHRLTGFIGTSRLGFSSSSFSVLPFLMTSGSAGAAGAAAAAASGAGASSAFGVHDVDDHHVGVARSASTCRPRSCRSRTRTPWCSISSLMSTVMCSGMSPGSTRPRSRG